MRKIVLLFLYFPIITSAQFPAFFHFGESYFLGVDIYDVVQSGNNEYFFSTNKGVVKYNGYDFSPLTNKQMKGVSVFGFVRDSNGVIYCYNLQHQIFMIKDGVMQMIYEIPERLQYFEIRLAISPENDLLILTKSLIKISHQGIKSEVLKEKLFDGRSSPVNFHRTARGSLISLALDKKLAELKSGKLRFSTLSGFIKADFESKSRFEWVTVNRITYLFSVFSGNVYLYDEENKTVEFYKKIKAAPHSGALRVYVVNNRIWIAGNSMGVLVFDGKFNPIYKGEKIYSDHFISNIMKDLEGNILLSTFDEGVIVIPDEGVQRLNFDGNDKITLLHSDQKNILFAGTKQGNIHLIENDIIKQIYDDPAGYGVNFLAFWKERNMLFHSNNQGVQISEWKNDHLRKIGEHPGAIKDISFSDDPVAVGAFNYGVTSLIIGDREVEYIKHDNLGFRTNCIAKDRITGSIYSGSSTGLKILKNGKELKQISYDNKPVYANAIVQKHDTVFVGTRKNGIQLYHRDTLINTIPFQFPVHKMRFWNNKIFIQSENKLYLIDQNNKIVQINNASGLDFNNINDFDVVGSKLYITDSKVIDCIDIGRLFQNIPVLPIVLQNVEVNNMPIIDNVLPFEQNRVKFSFAVNTLRYRDNMLYRYKLEGYENDWNYVNYYENEVVYNALPPGEFIFLVQSLNGTTLSEPVSFPFSIATPYFQKWWFYLMLAVAFGVLLMIMYNIRIRRIQRNNNEKVEKQKMQFDLVESELKALRSQMNPHFIFNSLNSIQDLILKEDTDASYDYIVMFADLVRNTLNYSNKEFIPLENEIELLNTYLSLEKLRFKDDLQYSIHTPEDLDVDIPSLMLQPFVENALLHGLLHKEGEKTLKISFQFDDRMVCIIEDNGIGRSKANEIRKRQGFEHNSFALEAMKKRLQVFNKKEGVSTGGFTIEDVDPLAEFPGTKVIINLPFKRRY